MWKLATRTLRWVRGALGTALWFGVVFAVLGVVAFTAYDVARGEPSYPSIEEALLRLMAMSGAFGVVTGALFSVPFTLVALLFQREVTARRASWIGATVPAVALLDLLNLTWTAMPQHLVLANAMGIAVVSAMGGVAGGSMVLLARRASPVHG